MKRYIYFFFAAFSLAILFSGNAEATKPGYSCANVRCASGSCVETPGGPVCQAQQLTCASMLCAQGSVCEMLSNGPQCVIQSSPPGYYVPNPPSTYHPPHDQTPPGYYNPNPPNYGNQSCAYGGRYEYGRLICNPAPRWREPYQNGWRDNPYRNRYDNWRRDQDRVPPGYHVPPTYQPRPTPPRHSRPGNGHLPEPIVTPPSRTMCPMIYAPVCASKPVVCVKAPCRAPRRTFSNSCMANAEEFTILYKGECQ